MNGPGGERGQRGADLSTKRRRLTLLDGLAGGSEDRLDLVRVDQSGDVRGGDLGGGEAGISERSKWKRGSFLT